MLHPKIAEELRELRDQMEVDGKLLSQSQLDTYYQNLRRRFVPMFWRTQIAKIRWGRCSGEKVFDDVEKDGSRKAQGVHAV